MSGDIQYRVNRYFTRKKTTYNGICIDALFWEFMQFFADHPGFSFVGYGTGKSQLGEEPPSAWLDFDPYTTDVVPWGGNSWFVVNADLAANELDGSGDQQWQAKFQVSGLGVAFDDCNVANVNYWWEGTANILCCRPSVRGGWDETTLDFSPVGGEDPGYNFVLSYNDGYDVFAIDIIGDNDTVFWRGACCASDIVSQGPPRSRGGYLGLVRRRFVEVDYPFIFAAGRMYDETANAGYRATNHCADVNNTYYAWKREYVIWKGADQVGSGGAWPAHSLWIDGSRCYQHQLDTWGKHYYNYFQRDVDDDDINYAIKVAQYESPNRYAILGELRLVAKVGQQYDHGVRYGDSNEWLQIAYGALNYSGIGMKWPAGTVNLW